MADFLLTFSFVLAGLTAFGAAAFYIFVWRPRERFEIEGSLETVLYRILIPQDEIPMSGEARQKEPKDIMVAMEQLVSALEALRPSRWHDIRFGSPSVSFELALPHVGQEVIFYAAVPQVAATFFANQMHSFFPSAKIDHVEDYNLFHPTGVSAGSVAHLTKDATIPLRTYKDLGEDPLAVMVGAFSKLKHMGDGAAIQFVVRPARDVHYQMGKEVAQKIRAGSSVKEALGNARGDIKIKHVVKEQKSQQDTKDHKSPDEEIAKEIESKAGSRARDVNIRLVASSSTAEETFEILQGLEAAFAQFAHPQGNAFKFERLGGKALEEMLYDFSFRLFDRARSLYLSSTELAGMFHFPYAGFHAPNVMYLTAREAPPPPVLPESGLRLGYNLFRGAKKEIFMSSSDRQRHTYVIGQTGTGKSALLREMARQDIEAGHGVCFMDPHGQDVESLLEVIPEHRMKDVIYFNPGDVERPMGLNFLEYDPRFPEQKTFIVNELLSIFEKLYGDVPEALGPMFQQYFRNATMLVMEDPTSGATLMEVGRVMADKEFRDMKLSRCSNPVVELFWRKIAEKTGGEASLANMVPYITSKTDTFTGNEIMRPIIAQQKSALNFREIMDTQKILLVNLSKGRLGELNSYLLGLVIIGKILMASLSRTDMPESERKNFYLYIDEFQNVTTNSIATILSEARKYRLNLIVAHQFLGQLTDDIKKAVFGNVGSILSFRIGTEDGEFMEKQFSPVFSARDLSNIENHNAYGKLLIQGQPSRPFSLKTYAPKEGSEHIREMVVEYSRRTYGRAREEVEAEVRARYQKLNVPASPVTSGTAT